MGGKVSNIISPQSSVKTFAAYCVTGLATATAVKRGRQETIFLEKCMLRKSLVGLGMMAIRLKFRIMSSNT